MENRFVMRIIAYPAVRGRLPCRDYGADEIQYRILTPQRVHVKNVQQYSKLASKMCNAKLNSRQKCAAIRFSERNLKKDGAFVNIPLYLAPRFSACLQ